MAVLSDADRKQIYLELMRLWSREHIPTSLLKAEVRDFIDRTDDWIETNKGSYNTALSANQKLMTAKEKARGFMIVAEKKFKGLIGRCVVTVLDGAVVVGPEFGQDVLGREPCSGAALG